MHIQVRCLGIDLALRQRIQLGGFGAVMVASKKQASRLLLRQPRRPGRDRNASQTSIRTGVGPVYIFGPFYIFVSPARISSLNEGLVKSRASFIIWRNSGSRAISFAVA